MAVAPSFAILSLLLTSYVSAQLDTPTTYISTDANSQPLNISLPLPPSISQSTVSTPGNNPPLLLSCPRGSAVEKPAPTVYDETGDVIWIGEEWGECFGLNAQWYNGSLIMSVWVGEIQGGGWGKGTNVLIDSTYTNIKNVTAVSPTGADIHEFNIVPQGSNTTALLTTYVPIGPIDLSSAQGPNPGFILDVWIQEVDIPTGNLIFNWSALEHMNFTESFAAPGATGDSVDNPWDAFHLNSADKDANGDYLISSRHLHQVLKVSHTDGSVIWRMGGFANTFNRGNGTNFEWQHHARWHTNDTQMTIFDNAASNFAVNESSARGLLLDVDQTALTVNLNAEFLPVSNANYSQSQGSVFIQADGNILVGWGSQPFISEYLANGTAIFDAKIGPVDAPGDQQTAIQNYRAFKTLDWNGLPATPPTLGLQNTTNSDGSVSYTAFVSWNGATGIQSYNLIGGSSSDNSSFTTLGNTTRNGFESSIAVSNSSGTVSHVSIIALGADGTEKGRTGIYQLDGTLVSNGTVSAVPTPTPSPSTDKGSSGSGTSAAVGLRSSAAILVGAIGLGFGLFL